MDGRSFFDIYSTKELTDMASEERAPSNTSASNIAYRPVYKHWFYKLNQASKSYWTTFSFNDSMVLEDVYSTKCINYIFYIWNIL